MSLLDRCCICGSVSGHSLIRHHIETVACERCGLHRQVLNMTEKELGYWYKDYQTTHYTHSYGEDKAAARKRLKNYKLKSGMCLLDVGCGNGAFVVEARKQKIKAVGQDISSSGCKTRSLYTGPLQDVMFPTDHFDVVTMHDVIEHMLDPKAALLEVRRILKQDGKLFLEWPNFWESGKHWKPIEHLWMFHPEQLGDLLLDCGFSNIRLKHPHSEKLLLVASKPKEKRVDILIPPGIGDGYWPLVKMRSFVEKNKLGTPDIHIVSNRSKRRDRSIDFVQSIPFVHGAGYLQVDNKDPLWREAYLQDGRTIFEDVKGMDYFIAYNGVTRWGKSLEEVDPEYETEWFLPQWRPLESRRYVEKIKQKYGDYIVAYFISHGMYMHWINAMAPRQIQEMLLHIAKLSGKKILLVGASWDQENLNAILMKRDNSGALVDLTGRTSCHEILELMRQASGVIGFPSGITILATAYRTPTIMLWHKYFLEEFWRYSCPPHALHQWYEPVDIQQAIPLPLAQRFLRLTGDIESPQRIPLAGIPKADRARAQINAHKANRRKGRKSTEKRRKGRSSRSATVLCVLRSGGDFGPEYVHRLRDAVFANLRGVKHEFVCLSDIDVPCERIPLRHIWPGWWSKLELFRPCNCDGRKIIYFDLDTVIVGDLKPLVNHDFKFMMLQGFKHKQRRASGVMAWQGDFSRIYKVASKEFSNGFFSQHLNDWDQVYIERKLKEEYGLEPEIVQHAIGVSSYKRHFLERGKLIPDTRIVCFHGKPRPHELGEELKPEWMRRTW